MIKDTNRATSSGPLKKNKSRTHDGGRKTKRPAINPVSRATLVGRVRFLEGQMLAVQEVLRAYGNAIDELSEPFDGDEDDGGPGEG